MPERSLVRVGSGLGFRLGLGFGVHNVLGFIVGVGTGVAEVGVVFGVVCVLCTTGVCVGACELGNLFHLYQI
jgi:hypothetical protein